MGITLLDDEIDIIRAQLYMLMDILPCSVRDTPIDNTQANKYVRPAIEIIKQTLIDAERDTRKRLSSPYDKRVKNIYYRLHG